MFTFKIRPEWKFFCLCHLSFTITDKHKIIMGAHGVIITKHKLYHLPSDSFVCGLKTQRKLADHEVACQGVCNFPFIKMCL